MLVEFQNEYSYAATLDLHPDLPVEIDQARPTHEVRSFELPSSVWWLMFTCYGIFFSSLFVATGHSASAIFVLIISIGYALVYFGTASILDRVGADERHGLPSVTLASGLETYTGHMSAKAVYGQILVVPFALVLFGIGFAVVHAVIW